MKMKHKLDEFIIVLGLFLGTPFLYCGDLFDLNLSSETQAQIKTLTFIDPFPMVRFYHGNWTKDLDGKWKCIADPKSLQDLATELKLEKRAVRFLAEFIATRDNMAQLSHEFAQAETSYRAVQQMTKMHEDEREDLLIKKKKWILENKTKMTQEFEELSDRAISAYKELENKTGKKKLKKIFRVIRKKTDERSKQREEEGAKKTQLAIKRCQKGLKSCSFPEGLVENCAAYLDMSIKELKRRCPHPRRLE